MKKLYSQRSQNTPWHGDFAIIQKSCHLKLNRCINKKLILNCLFDDIYKMGSMVIHQTATTPGDFVLDSVITVAI